MALNLSLGGTTFNLVISSDAIDASLVSVKFLPNNSNTNALDDRDAIIDLNDFTGTLFIRHPSSICTENLSSNNVGSENQSSLVVAKTNNVGKEGECTISSSISTLARTKERLKDFDEELDHIVISHGEEWCGRLTGYDVKVERDTDVNPSPSQQQSQPEVQQQHEPPSQSNVFGHSCVTINHDNSNKLENTDTTTAPAVSSVAVGTVPIFPKRVDFLKPQVSTDNNDINKNDSTRYINNMRLASTSPMEDLYDDDDSSDSLSDGLSLLSITNCAVSRTNVNYRNESKLHRACKSAKAKVKILNRVLHDSPEDASTKDSLGQTPLHVVAQNQHLLFGRDADIVQVFIHDLIKEFPYALLTQNDKGCIPFTTAIFNWINDVHHSCRTDIHYFDIHVGKEMQYQIPKVVYADPMVEWSFKMCYEVFNRIESANKIGVNSNLFSPVEEFIRTFACIPNLFKTSLLINDDALRYRIFDYSFIKRCYLIDLTVNDWLVVILSNKDTSQRGIEYFEGLSNLTTSVALGIAKPKITDIIRFRQQLEAVIAKISNMDYILPALFMLNEHDMKRACLTYPVQRILELSMTDPSLLGILIFDLCVHILLVLAFDVQEYYLLRESPPYFDVMKFFDAPVVMTSLICIYLFLREEVAHVLLVRRSFRKTMRRYRSFWHLIDLLSIILALSTNSILLVKGMDTPYEIFGITKVFIWLRLLGFLKGINLHLTMFVASVGKIIFDMRWFAVVLGLTMFMFGDIIHIIAYSNGNCDGIDYEIDFSGNADYCSDSLIRNMIRPFETITGNFELDDYRYSTTATIVFIIYILGALIILLNVLIAIVTESYSKSNSERYSLLGRARIPILAKHSYLNTKAFHISSRGRRDPIYCTILTIILLFFVLFAFSFVVLIRSIFTDMAFSTHSRATQLMLCYGQITLVSVLFIIANASIFITIKDLFLIKIRWIDESQFIQMITRKPIVPFVYAILGIESENKNGGGLDEHDILPAVKEMIDRCTSHIRSDLQKLKRTMKKSLKTRVARR